MEPKEKALNLIGEFTFKCYECDYEWKAKRSALKAVNQILDAIKTCRHNVEYINTREYWQSVKQEIEKL